MANVKYSARLGRYNDLDDYYDANNLAFVSGTVTQAVYRDAVTNNRIVLSGSNLDYNGVGVLTEGKIDKISFTNADDQAYINVSNAKLDAKLLMEEFQAGGLDAMLEKAFSGNDTITGSKIADGLYSGAGNDKIKGGAGEDYMFGGIGNDRLTGGAGSDLFHFSFGTGKDVVTDFDAIGGGVKQDHLAIHQSESDFTLKQVGDDLVLNFGGGHTLTLLDIDRSDFSKGGDVMFF